MYYTLNPPSLGDQEPLIWIQWPWGETSTHVTTYYMIWTGPAQRLFETIRVAAGTRRQAGRSGPHLILECGRIQAISNYPVEHGFAPSITD